MPIVQGQPLSDPPIVPSLPHMSPPSLILPDPPVEEISDIPSTIVIKQFIFEGNTVFSQKTLAALLENYLNRPITFSELLQARSLITQFYVDAGYVTSGAYIPPQEIRGETIKIAIIEGKISEIKVTVEGRLHPDYIRNRLALAADRPLNVKKLLSALQLLQIDPLIQGISAELAAGIFPGESILNVTATTANSFHFKVVLDNGRNPLVGSFRRGVEIREDNLLGLGDQVYGNYRNTDGTNDVELSYSIPVNPKNGRVDLSLRNLTGKIVEPPFDALDLASDYQKYALSFRQPIQQTPNKDFALGVTLDYQSNYSRTPFFPITSPGSDGEGYTRATTLRFFQEWTQRDETAVLALRSEFNLGIDALGSTVPFDINANPNAHNPQAFFWRGQVQWVKLLAPEMLFVFRSDLQLAADPLVPLEQFALGGLGSVVGYRQNVLLTDNGWFATAELRIPLYSLPAEDAVLHLIPFVDLGTGWNNGSITPAINTLASVGLGLQWRYGNGFSARVDVGFPLGRTPFEGNTWQDQGIVFTIMMGP